VALSFYSLGRKYQHCNPQPISLPSRPLSVRDFNSDREKMALIVQKYGGTSVGNTERIKNVATRVAKYRARGDKVVVVVSAMSGVTDNLIKLATEIMPLPIEREMDVLLATGEQTTIALTAMALHAAN